LANDLRTILSNIDWNSNAREFTRQRRRPEAFEKGSKLIAAWNYELSFYDRANRANSFLQEMKASLFCVPACTALGLIKPAAASLRAGIESALYYTFFRNHPAELETLHRSEKFYLSKNEIIEYHAVHSADFSFRQDALALLSDLNQWYSYLSAIIHGQIPGVWTSHSLPDISFEGEGSAAVLKQYKMGISIVNRLFLSTLERDVWEGLSSFGRQLFLGELDRAAIRKLQLSII
jgi:hypothetical protein